MRHWLAAALLALPGIAGAQALFDWREESLAFRAEVVDDLAGRAYQRRLESLRADGRLDVDPALVASMNGLVARLLAAAEIERPGVSRLAWQVHTCRRCGESASAAPGGRLLLGEEFLAELALSRDELAYLLAHEVAHVLAEHTREFAHAARYFVDNGLRREYWDIQRELDASLPAQYRMAFIAEQQELEADRIALFIGARAGFDPDAMARLLRKLSPAQGGPATHPSQRRRLEQVAAAMGAARILSLRAVADLAPDR